MSQTSSSPDAIIKPGIETDTAARILVARRTSGEQGPKLPIACRPTDFDTAMAIQAAVTALLDQQIGGWKCAMPAAGNPVLAPIYANTIHSASPCPVTVRDGQACIEPELAFVLGSDLPVRDAPYTPADVDAAIARTHLALELIDSRVTGLAELNLFEKLADGLVNQGLFLGPEVDAEMARLAEQIALTVSASGSETRDFDGRHPGGSPRAPLYWLAEYLRSQGQGLYAGQVIITGSYAGSFGVPVNETVSIQYGSLGTLDVRLTDR